VGQTVRIYLKNDQLACHGVITFGELHEDYEIEEMPDIMDLYIDTGLSQSALKKKGIDTGCYVIARHHFKTLGSDEIISGKALDDRIGCYILIEVARRLKKPRHDIYYVFTVQEEIGLYGAQVSSYVIEPDWGLAVDTINAEDSDEFTTKGIEMGKGPVLLLKDAETITTQRINEWVTNVAKKKRIPLQLKVEEVGSTDATKILLSREGIPATTVTVPVRNLHSTVSISHMTDIKQTTKLVFDLLNDPSKAPVARL
jgi:endoglucanase